VEDASEANVRRRIRIWSHFSEEEEEERRRRRRRRGGGGFSAGLVLGTRVTFDPPPPSFFSQNSARGMLGFLRILETVCRRDMYE
jgi:hypothetical protein